MWKWAAGDAHVWRRPRRACPGIRSSTPVDDAAPPADRRSPRRRAPDAGGDARCAGDDIRSSKSLRSHKPAGAIRPALLGVATVGAVTSVPAVGQRLARLLLLAVTALGVAALHTVGHAGVTQPAHHPALQAATAMAVAAPIPAEGDGCDGDGCTHQAAMPGSGDHNSRWWEACVAILAVLALGVLAAQAWWRIRGATGSAGMSLRRPPPPAGAVSPLGLALAAGTVLRT